MAMVELRKISDIDRIGREKIESILGGWDPVEETRRWIKTATDKRVPWKTEFDWNGNRNHSRFHPSSLDNPCDMSLYLQIAGGDYVKDSIAQSQAALDTSTAVHLQMHYYRGTRAIHHGYTYEHDVPLWKSSRTANDLQLCGEADGYEERLIKLPGDEIDIRFIWEYKIYNEDGFRKLTSPSAGYMKQVHAYMITGDIPLAVIMYVNKNRTIQMKAYKILFRPQTWDPIEARLRKLIQLKEEVKNPEKNMGSCKSCGYKAECGQVIRRYTRRSGLFLGGTR
jgi:hypothetical protein